MAESLTGTVSWFNVAKGFGFVTRTDGQGDVFVHQSDIKTEGFRSLREGELVEFGLELTTDGREKAVNVTGPGGNFVQGAPRRNFGGRGEGRGMGRGAGPAGAGRGAGRGRGRGRGPRPEAPEGESQSSGLQVVVLNLPWSATSQTLTDLFAAVGGVESAEIVVDESGRSRCEATSHAAARFGCVPPVPTHVNGYGTVRFTAPEQATKAIETVNNSACEERTLTVKIDRFG